MQKFIRVGGYDTKQVNEYLENGWIVKEFQSFNNRSNRGDYTSYAYVLLEKN